MARRNRQAGERRSAFSTDWSTERTLADVEAAAQEEETVGDSASDVACVCGSEEFLLEAYMHVVAGNLRPNPVEVEALTCPNCSREFEAIEGENGRILRGDFLGYAEEDDDDSDL